MFDVQYRKKPEWAQAGPKVEFSWYEWQAFKDGLMVALLNLTVSEYVDLRVRVAPDKRDFWDFGYRTASDLLKNASVRQGLAEMLCEGETDYEYSLD